MPGILQLPLKPVLDDAELEALHGTRLDENSWDVLIADDCDGVTESGDVVFKYRKNVIPSAACEPAYRALRTLHNPPTNRGVATIGEASSSLKPLLEDGRQSNTFRVDLREHPEMRLQSSAIIGFYDRYVRFPYCRATAFNLNEPEKFEAALPFIRCVNDVFKSELPERWEVQKGFIEKTHPDFYIHGTVFTTITVNKNWQTSVHVDAGDLQSGFGVMSVLRGGSYAGGHLVFPRYRVAVDMQTRGVCLADVHEPHGNTPIKGLAGRYERVSCVFYYRTKMQECGSAEEELERAKHRKPGDPLW